MLEVQNLLLPLSASLTTLLDLLLFVPLVRVYQAGDVSKEQGRDGEGERIGIWYRVCKVRRVELAPSTGKGSSGFGHARD